MILFHNDCHPLPLSRRKYDLEQKGIGMYYEMPTTKNFDRHSRRLWQASQVQLVLANRRLSQQQPGSLQRACSRAASVYSAPKGTFFATL